MPHRSYASTANYRFGFNGKENDNEPKGLGNQQDYGMRVYDPRIGKFLSVDPLTKSYSMLTPYQFSTNRPIDGIDLDGQEYLNYNTSLYRFVGGMTTNYKFTSNDVYITNIQTFNLGIGLPELNQFPEANTNPFDKEGQVDWESVTVPDRNKSALFNDWYKQMHNYNSLKIRGLGGAYFSPQIESSASRPATIFSAIMEIASMVQTYEKGQEIKEYGNKYSNEIKTIREHGNAFDKATSLVSAALEKKILPGEIANSKEALGDIVNWIIDGTVSTSNDVNRYYYTEIIKAWGKALISNETAVFSGTLLNQSQSGTIYYGSKARDRESTSLSRGIYIPTIGYLPYVREALELTRKHKDELNKKSNDTIKSAN